VIQRELGLAKYEFTEDEKEKLLMLEENLCEVFDVSVDLRGLVREKMSERKSRKWLYQRLLDRIQPKVAVIVAGAFKHTFIEVCKNRDIPVVELQHGVIYRGNTKHDFPSDVDIYAYPDYILTFGKYWCECVNYPINNDNIIPVGYPYLEEESKKHTGEKKDNQVIFISQPPIAQDLSEFAVKLSEKINTYDIVYKLHPKNYHGWRDKYPWLESADLRVIDTDDPSLYQLFAKSKLQVGVGSTAIYEGLNFSLDTYIVDMYGKHVTEDLVSENYATLVGSVEDLIDEIDSEKTAEPDIEQIFKNNAIKNIQEELINIQINETNE
jgi:hypothetical protein